MFSLLFLSLTLSNNLHMQRHPSEKLQKRNLSGKGWQSFIELKTQLYLMSLLCTDLDVSAVGETLDKHV